MKAQLVVLALVGAAMFAPLSSAQIKSCGDLELFIANPDLRDVGSDGKYHVAGDFYMQFQVQGDGASDIETFGFSVGLPPENPEQICETPEPLPMWAGFMLESYKADFDKEDGFFIYMSTSAGEVPKHTDLTVSVHAYDAAGVEKARFWTTAVIESCEGPVSAERCDPDEMVSNDNTAPWPMVLPGDGPQDFVDGIYIDFGEALAEGSLTVYLNGDDITADLTEMGDDERKQLDADTWYDRGPLGIGETLTDPCESPQTCAPGRGPAYKWTERKMTPDDVVRVEATDVAGNSVVKEIHMAQAAAGGTLEGGIPILEMTFVEPNLVGGPGDVLAFEMEMENTGSGEGHPFEHPWVAGENYPEGWSIPVWEPGHQPVPAKGTSTQTLLVTIPENVTEGNYKFTPRMDYKQAGADKSVQSVVTAIVEIPEDFTAATDSIDEEQESPAVGIVFALVALAAVAALPRRRP